MSTPSDPGGVPVGPAFSPEPFREVGHRVLVTRKVAVPTVVLGSNQDVRVVDRRRAAAAGAEVVRRRSGGGAVWLEPGDPLWIGVWLPRADPLWEDDVSRSGSWVGTWWLRSLSAAFLLSPSAAIAVHRGAPLRTAWSDLICFAGIVGGELEVGRTGAPPRKLVGMAQWRGREGALFHCAVYRRWDPSALLTVLNVPDDDRFHVTDDLATAAAGLADIAPGADEVEGATLERALIAELADDAPWEIRQSG